MIDKKVKIEKHKIVLIAVLLLMAIAILSTIMIILTLPKSQSNTQTAETNDESIPSEIQELNSKIEETDKVLFSSDNQDANIEGLISEYSETISNGDSSINDKYIATLQSSKLYNFQQNYSASIEALNSLLDTQSLDNAKKYQILSQLEYTHYLNNDSQSRIDTINAILALPDDTDLQYYNTDMTSVKENYQSILNQLQTSNEETINE